MLNNSATLHELIQLSTASLSLVIMQCHRRNLASPISHSNIHIHSMMLPPDCVAFYSQDSFAKAYLVPPDNCYARCLLV